LLSGAFTSEALMRERAAQLGYDISQPYVAAHVQLSDDGSPASHDEAARVMELAETLEVALGAWTLARDRSTIALAPLPSAEGSIQGLRERLEPLLTRTLGGGLGWAAGLGEPAIGAASLRQSAIEARDAAN